MKRLIYTLTLVAIASSSVFAQADWKTKNFDTWTRDDVRMILEESAWVKKQEVRLQREATRNVAAGSFNPNVVDAGGRSGNSTVRAAGNTVNQGAIQPAVDFTFVVRLRSSMAVRLALVRQLQLEDGNKELSADEAAASKKKQIGLYQCPTCTDNYVVTLTSSSKENRNFDPVYTSFGQARIDEIKNYIVLSDGDGGKRELTHFVPPLSPGSEAVFFFKRNDSEGRPLFVKDSKEILFNTTNNEVSLAVNFKLEIAPLVVGDKVDF